MELYRPHMKSQSQESKTWDVCIIGGGATGLGIAVEAANSGLSTLLLERGDFAQGTSSRSTKLVHGGVRYLEQRKFSLVREALQERDRMLHNAPHEVTDQAFIIPVKSIWHLAYYGLGLLLYDLLAGRRRWGRTAILSKSRVHTLLPRLEGKGFVGGLQYLDGKFDDVGLALALAKTAAKKGAVLLNHAKVIGFQKKKGRIQSASIEDGLHGDALTIKARAFVNATGPFSDALCRLDNPKHKNRLKPSQGVHLTFDAEVLPGDKAVLIPKTSDGRVVFAVPWHGKVLIGTTDTAVDQPEIEPRPLAQEVDFVLDHANRHLGLNLGRKDIRSMFAGLRPLIKGRLDKTAALSRSHQIKTSKSGLTSVRGGKWTTYRKMAEDTLAHLKKKTKLRFEPASTQDMVLESQSEFDRAVLPDSESELTQAVLQAHRKEMCITVEDFLSRRRRILYLDARKAIDAAPIVARALASAQGRGEEWIQSQINLFTKKALGHLP